MTGQEALAEAYADVMASCNNPLPLHLINDIADIWAAALVVALEKRGFTVERKK